jgi:hypothetical protein
MTRLDKLDLLQVRLDIVEFFSSDHEARIHTQEVEGRLLGTRYRGRENDGGYGDEEDGARVVIG